MMLRKDGIYDIEVTFEYNYLQRISTKNKLGFPVCAMLDLSGWGRA